MVLTPKQPPILRLIINIPRDTLLNRRHVLPGHPKVPLKHTLRVPRRPRLNHQDQHLHCLRRQVPLPLKILLIKAILYIHECTNPIKYHDHRHKLHEYMIVINPNTVHDHSAMVVVLDAAAITR